MKLLMSTFAVDPANHILATQFSVVTAMARRVDRLLVITEELGTAELPSNVEVLVVRRPLRWTRMEWWRRLYARIWRKRIREFQPDVFFAHMAYEWVLRLEPVLLRESIPIAFWYSHGHVPPRLAEAHALAQIVFTGSEGGFNLASSKKRVLGQVVDTRLFRPLTQAGYGTDIVAVGRVTPVKRIERMIETFDEVKQLRPDVPFRLRIIGPLDWTRSDAAYAARVMERARASAHAADIEWTGAVAQHDVALAHASAFLHLNLCDGGADKAVFEALACGCPVLTTNQSLHGMLKDYPEMGIPYDAAPAALAARISQIYDRLQTSDASRLRTELHGFAHDNVGIDSYVDRILAELERIAAAGRPART